MRLWGRRTAAGLAALVLLAGACSSGSDPGGEAITPEATIGLSDTSPVDTGVIESYEQEAMSEDTPVEIPRG